MHTLLLNCHILNLHYKPRMIHECLRLFGFSPTYLSLCFHIVIHNLAVTLCPIRFLTYRITPLHLIAILSPPLFLHCNIFLALILLSIAPVSTQMTYSYLTYFLSFCCFLSCLISYLRSFLPGRARLNNALAHI